MANKLIKRRYNNLLTARNHYFKFGDFLFKPNESGQVANRSIGNLSTLGEGLAKAAGAAVGTVGGGLIGGGLQSGAGNVFQGLSGIASAIPGPWGAAATAGLGLVGGITNRMFGSKLNTENIAKVESNIDDLNSFQSNASDYDALAQSIANAPIGMTFSNSFIGKDGWLSNKAKNKAADLRRQVETGNAWVQSSLANNAENIGNTQMQNLLGNYAAFGGPLFAEGGRIHIKPENRGKFTETKRRTGKTTEELTHSKNPVTRKRAIFALNSRHWNKHSNGGYLEGKEYDLDKLEIKRLNARKGHHAFGGWNNTHGGDFYNGVTQINSGGLHSTNPNEGVQMGMDSEGIPNLVEEGEVVFNDYVYSNRLKVPKAVRKKYKLRGNKPLTFADAAIQMSKESEERPNDPISQAGLEDGMTKLMMAQEQIRTRQNGHKFAKGGRMGRVYAGEEGDPYSQILSLGRGPRRPAAMWVFEPPKGEPPTPVKNEMGIVLGGYTSNPTIIKPGESTIPEIMDIQRTKYPSPPVPKKEDDNIGLKSAPTWMRYVPAFASGIMSLTDAAGLTNKPDYGEVEGILEASRGAGTYQPVSFNPVGNYLTYRPFDRDYYTNKLNAEASASRRALLNTVGGNRAQAMAGLLASDYNTQGKMGDLFRQAEEYNLAQRQKAEEFNRATDMFNSEGFFKADAANQSALMNARQSYLKGAITAAELRQKERQTAMASRSANLSNFINSIGDIGRENFSRNMIMSDPSKYYGIDANGNVFYKRAFDDLDDASQTYIIGDATKAKQKQNSNNKKKARGGYLTIGKK